MKKDASQIGINAREAVKFLDRVTSGKDGLPENSIMLQGPDEQYGTWSQVEEHLLKDDAVRENGSEENEAPLSEQQNGDINAAEESNDKVPGSAGGALSQMLLSKLNFAKEPDVTSTASSPPSSPLSSSPQSSKTSPEVKIAKLAERETTIVPPVLKPLLNSVVWYTYEKPATSKAAEILFLSNAADTASLARSFGVNPKNIHQLRSAIGLEDLELKNHSKYEKKHPSPPATAVVETKTEPKPLFKYDEESDDEEVVFKPRGRGSRGTNVVKGTSASSVRGKPSHHRSPVPTFTTPTRTAQKKPEVPTEEIDPDSFDRGSFGRGSTPLASTTGHIQGQFQGHSRGGPTRGNFSPTGPSRGGFHRGTARGFDRGSTRGRGRLFVP